MKFENVGGLNLRCASRTTRNGAEGHVILCRDCNSLRVLENWESVCFWTAELYDNKLQILLKNNLIGILGNYGRTGTGNLVRMCIYASYSKRTKLIPFQSPYNSSFVWKNDDNFVDFYLRPNNIFKRKGNIFYLRPNNTCIFLYINVIYFTFARII